MGGSAGNDPPSKVFPAPITTALASLCQDGDRDAHGVPRDRHTQDAGEPFDDAAKTWVPPMSTPHCEVKITNGGWIISTNGDKSSFGGNAKVDTV
jgi:hypothetical protein